MKGIFLGKIYPERSDLTIGAAIPCAFSADGYSIKALLDIKSAVVTVTILDSIDASNFATIRNSAQSLVRKFANYATLETNAYNFAVLETFVDSDSGSITILAHHEILDGISYDRVEREIDFNIINNGAVSQALHAYNKALIEHDFTAKYSQEAIEAVREHWGRDRWDDMRKHLNLREDTLKRHLTAATDQKHGRNSLQTWEQRHDQLLIARAAILRLIAFIRTGADLPEDQYPEF